MKYDHLQYACKTSYLSFCDSNMHFIRTPHFLWSTGVGRWFGLGWGGGGGGGAHIQIHVV